MSSISIIAPAWLTANPAVDLMARLSYPKKIQAIGLIAGVAILLLTGQLFFSLSGQIQRASLERTGLLLVQPLRAVIEPLQQHRGLTNAWASADGRQGQCVRTPVSDSIQSGLCVFGSYQCCLARPEQTAALAGVHELDALRQRAFSQ